jgi:hypothetical protein
MKIVGLFFSILLTVFFAPEAMATGYPVTNKDSNSSSSGGVTGRSNAPENYFDSEKDILAPCTSEAKVCPDGSTVARVPPSCEFAPCPGEVEEKTESEGEETSSRLYAE